MKSNNKFKMKEIFFQSRWNFKTSRMIFYVYEPVQNPRGRVRVKHFLGREGGVKFVT
jgi:hypothetical protein